MANPVVERVASLAHAWKCGKRSRMDVKLELLQAVAENPKYGTRLTAAFMYRLVANWARWL